MKCFIDNNQNKKAIQLYQQYDTGTCNDTSHSLFIKACSNIGYYDKCFKLINSCGNINNRNIEFINVLIHFYAKIGDINHSLNIFNNISSGKRDVISINTIINCLINNNRNEKAIELYEEYCKQYDNISHISFIRACGNIGYYNKCESLINSVINDISNQSIEFINTLIDFYGKMCDIKNAEYIFNNIPCDKKDIISISVMMNAYNNNGEYYKSLKLFNDTITINPNIKLNEYIYCIALNVAGNIVSLNEGENIIFRLNKSENVHFLKSLKLQSSIINMYSKCSKFDCAIDIFNNININTDYDCNYEGILYLYSSIMYCYSKQCDINQLLLTYNQLKQYKNIKIPDNIYCILLNGCSHCGLADNALSIFNEYIESKNENNVSSNIITALIDCLGRKGIKHLNDAEDLYFTYIENNINLYYKLKLPPLFSLLSSCRIHKDIMRSKRISDKINNLIENKDENNRETSMNVLLSDIYTQNKEFDKSNEIRNKMKEI